MNKSSVWRERISQRTISLDQVASLEPGSCVLSRGGIRPNTNTPAAMAALALILITIALQILYFGSVMDNQPTNLHSPGCSDCHEYVSRAQSLASGWHFSTTFQDGYRLPGYPVFLSLFYLGSNVPLLLVRYAQVILASVSIGIFYLTLQKIMGNAWFSVLGCLIAAVWLPFYEFSPIVTCESLSIFFVCVLCFLLSYFRQSCGFSTIATGICLSVLIYLKPNHVFLWIPCAVFFFYVNKSPSLVKRIFPVVVSALLVVLTVIPWTLFISLKNETLVPLSTTQGMNLYAGTGQHPDLDGSAKGSLPLKIATKFKLYSKPDYENLKILSVGMNHSQSDNLFFRHAIDAWLARPLHTSMFGMAKVLHMFGFSFRDARDVILVLHFLFTIAASLYVWVKGSNREWCIFFWAVFVVAILQAFLFLPNQRFKTVVYDFPSFLMVALAIREFVRFGESRDDVAEWQISNCSGSWSSHASWESKTGVESKSNCLVPIVSSDGNVPFDHPLNFR